MRTIPLSGTIFTVPTGNAKFVQFSVQDYEFFCSASGFSIHCGTPEDALRRILLFKGICLLLFSAPGDLCDLCSLFSLHSVSLCCRQHFLSALKIICWVKWSCSEVMATKVTDSLPMGESPLLQCFMITPARALKPSLGHG